MATPCARAKRTDAANPQPLRQQAISAGRRSIMPFQTIRVAS
jgi:hypothetical protein